MDGSVAAARAERTTLTRPTPKWRLLACVRDLRTSRKMVVEPRDGEPHGGGVVLVDLAQSKPGPENSSAPLCITRHQSAQSVVLSASPQGDPDPLGPIDLVVLVVLFVDLEDPCLQLLILDRPRSARKAGAASPALIGSIAKDSSVAGIPAPPDFAVKVRPSFSDAVRAMRRIWGRPRRETQIYGGARVLTPLTGDPGEALRENGGFSPPGPSYPQANGGRERQRGGGRWSSC
jgi:hypothetical protein